MKICFTVLAVCALGFSAPSLRADLLGTEVTGTLTFGSSAVNYFDPANGRVPKKDGNRLSAIDVPIGSGVEFGFNDRVNRDTANFNANRLTVRDVCLDGTDCSGNSPFTMTFTDPAFASVILLTNSLGVTYSFAGDVLTIHDAGTSVPDGNASAIFRIGSVAATPEPGSIALVATGLLGAAGGLRRRFLA